MILQDQNLRQVITYAALLTLAIYTEPASYIPAVGYALFLLAYAYRPDVRRALWYILPATAAPALLYLPYYVWVSPQRNTHILTVRPPFSDAPLWSQMLHSLAPETQLANFGEALFILLVLGLIAGAWSSFPPFLWPLKLRVNLFSFAGSSAVSILFGLAYASGFNLPLLPQQILFGAPGLVILSFAALDWLVKSKPQLKSFTYAPAALILALLCGPAIYEFVTTPTPDLGELVKTASASLTPQSCIVFVSEGESPFLFLLYDPDLWKHECRDFFSRRIVLASHPWVRPDQQRDAELFFRGLNFTESQRIRVAGGLIIIDEAR